jgi:hypothetical protein
MQRIAVLVHLKPGAGPKAEAMLAKGPPFDPQATRFERHTVYLGRDEAVFVFEGPDAEWELDDLTSDAFHPMLQEALREWRPLVDGPPRLARPVFEWERGKPPGAA